MKHERFPYPGAIDTDGHILKPHPDKTYVNQASFGAMDPKERLACMDQEGLEKAIIAGKARQNAPSFLPFGSAQDRLRRESSRSRGEQWPE